MQRSRRHPAGSEGRRGQLGSPGGSEGARPRLRLPRPETPGRAAPSCGGSVPTEPAWSAAPGASGSTGPTHLAALPARRTGANRTAPGRTDGTAPHRSRSGPSAPSSAEPGPAATCRAVRGGSGAGTGAEPRIPASRRRGTRQSPARAGPVPAGNPSPARPDWKSPAGCAAGPGRGGCHSP